MYINHPLRMVCRWLSVPQTDFRFVNNLLVLDESRQVLIFLLVFSLSGPCCLRWRRRFSKVTVSARELLSMGVSVISKSLFVITLLRYNFISMVKRDMAQSLQQNYSMEPLIFPRYSLQSYQLIVSSQEFSSMSCQRYFSCWNIISSCISIRLPQLLSMASSSFFTCIDISAILLCLSQQACTFSATYRTYNPSNFSLASLNSFKAVSMSLI